MDVVIRTGEACNAFDPYLLPDTVWHSDKGLGDFALAGPDEVHNRGGLSAKRGLLTAVALCLFTDKRVPPDHPLAYLADGDPRGYWGDGVDVLADLGETELGSLLWLLERAPLSDDIIRWAKRLTVEALMPLQAQNAVTRIDAQTSADKAAGRLEIVVQLYGRANEKVFDAKFDVLWQQIQG